MVAKRKSEDLIDHLLINRGGGINQKYKYLHPDFENGLYNPNLLKNIDQATALIKEAKDNNKTIGIFGDYDADGVTSTVLLEAAQRKVGIRTQVYIPSRDEGYGLSNKGIDWLIGKGTDIIITVDLGITAISE